MTDGAFPVLYLLHGLTEDHTMWMRPLEVGDVGALLAESVQFGNRERSVFRDDVGGDQLAADPVGDGGLPAGPPENQLQARDGQPRPPRAPAQG